MRMYQGNPSIADRMKVLDFKASLLRKQDGGGAMAEMPGQVSPPSAPPSAPPMPAEPDMGMMDAMATGQTYENNHDFLMDMAERFQAIAVDCTNHMGTIDRQATMDQLEMNLPNQFLENI